MRASCAFIRTTPVRAVKLTAGEHEFMRSVFAETDGIPGKYAAVTERPVAPTRSGSPRPCRPTQNWVGYLGRCTHRRRPRLGAPQFCDQEAMTENTRTIPPRGPAFHAADAEEQRKIREQIRDYELKRELLAAEKFVTMGHIERLASLQESNTQERTLVRNLFLLNGGSIVAALTFIGTLYGKDPGIAKSVAAAATAAFGWFAAGLAATVLCTAMSAIALASGGENEMDNADAAAYLYKMPRFDRPVRVKRAGILSVFAGLSLVIAALICWLVGAYRLSAAFGVVGT